MRTSNSSPVQFIGQDPLPEFDYSQQPLPDSIRVLIWMLDGAERRHRLARRWQGQRPSRRSGRWPHHGYPARNEVRRDIL
jgi:hypothetical protein